MYAAAAFVALIAAVSVLSPVQGLDYFTGQTHRRSLQQGPGGGTCTTGPKSAQYRCMSLTSRSSGYQFCSRLCDTGLGRRNNNNDDSDNSPSPPASVVGSSANGGNNTRLESSGGLGGASLGGSTGGSGACAPCKDVQQQCQQGESSGGGLSNAYYKAYVNRYYSGVGCQDIGPSVAVGGSGNSSPSP